MERPVRLETGRAAQERDSVQKLKGRGAPQGNKRSTNGPNLKIFLPSTGDTETSPVRSYFMFSTTSKTSPSFLFSNTPNPPPTRGLPSASVTLPCTTHLVLPLLATRSGNWAFTRSSPYWPISTASAI